MWSRDLSKIKQIPSGKQSDGGTKFASGVGGKVGKGKELYLMVTLFVKILNIYKLCYKL